MANITKEQYEEMKSRVEKSRYIPLAPKKADPVKHKGKTPHKEVQEQIYKDSLVLSQKVNIAPLSVNKAWVGRRFKTPEYTKYETKVLKLLNAGKLPIAPYKLTIEYGFSNKASDIDNPIKLVIDILQKKYKFNDKEIYKLDLVKKIVTKGSEYFEFELTTL